MINPTDVINYNRTLPQLQEFLLFCIFVANKSANQTAKKLHKFLGAWEAKPFVYVRWLIRLEKLEEHLITNKAGQYRRISKALRQVVALDLSKCTRDDLIAIHGIGMKTASYFLSCTRKDEKYLVADVHILKFCRALGWTNSIQTPDKKHYLELEKKYLDFCQENQLDSTELDLELWKYYSGNSHNLPAVVKYLLT